MPFDDGVRVNDRLSVDKVVDAFTFGVVRAMTWGSCVCSRRAVHVRDFRFDFDQPQFQLVVRESKGRRREFIATHFVAQNEESIIVQSERTHEGR